MFIFQKLVFLVNKTFGLYFNLLFICICYSQTNLASKLFIFRRQGTVNHCRIRSKQERGETKYYLIDAIAFDNLYSLISYYQTNQLRSPEFCMTLTEPVPQPNKHEGKE